MGHDSRCDTRMNPGTDGIVVSYLYLAAVSAAKKGW